MNAITVLACLFIAVFSNAIGFGFAAFVWAVVAVLSFVQMLRDEYGDGEEDEP